MAVESMCQLDFWDRTCFHTSLIAVDAVDGRNTCVTYVTRSLRPPRARYGCSENATLEERISVRPSLSTRKVASVSLCGRVKYEKLWTCGIVIPSWLPLGGGLERHSSPWARALCARELAGGKCNGSSAVGARIVECLACGVTKHCRRENGALVVS